MEVGKTRDVRTSVEVKMGKARDGILSVTYNSETGRLVINSCPTYIQEMEKLHKNPITIYGTNRHLQSLDVT